jgi:ribonucleoside-triphosphate reductase
MRTVAEIDADIAKVKAELNDVHGTTTEVYARIVGYYRSVRNWNPGKREEYNHRKLFVADESRINEHLPTGSGCACESGPSVMIKSATQAASIMKASEDALRETAKGPAFRYELFTRKTCPNCPPVKACCENLPVSGEIIDVDTEVGMIRASSYGVFSTPTVIFFDADSAEIGRAHSVKEIRALPALSAAEAVLA